MNITDTGKVLAKIQAFDHRTIGDSEIMVWHECIGDLDVDDCMAAVTIHYRESTEWLSPAHVRRIVADLDRKRRGAQRRAQLAHMRAADGSPLALEASERPVAAAKPREVAELIERLAAKLPAVTVEQKARRRARQERGRPPRELTNPPRRKRKPPKDHPHPQTPEIAALARRYLYDGHKPVDVAERLGVSRRWCEKAERKMPPLCTRCGNRTNSSYHQRICAREETP